MELEFDKEMDALLRRAAGRGVLIGDDPKAHLDADTIAAFAENALPVKSRTIYTQHLAACDPCRKLLANLISLNDAEPAFSAAAAPVPATATPWYQKFFAAPELAYMMGGLVLVFGGLLGVFVLQNTFNSGEMSVSRVAQDQAQPIAPARAEGANSLANANSSTNSTSNVEGEIPRSVGVADQPFTESDPVAAAPPPVVTADTTSADPAPAKPMSIDGVDKDKAVAATQPAPKEAAKREDDERSRNETKLAAEQELRKQDANATNQYNQQNQVQMTPGAGNKSTGPNRAAQRDNRAYDRQMNDDATKAKRAEAPATTTVTGEGGRSSLRTAGGKKFELKQGAWYDTAYSGQATKNVQRGTEDFNKLDSGLRSIANNIGGTVVVVWKSKAYRIQ